MSIATIPGMTTADRRVKARAAERLATEKAEKARIAHDEALRDDSLRNEIGLPITHSMTAGGVVVPGGVITIDRDRQRNRVWTWIQIVLQAQDETRLKRDIVIHDASRSRELYREGPYSGITVKRAIDGIGG
jgi:hypothetical protein